MRIIVENGVYRIVEDKAAIEKELATHDPHEVKMGKKAEKEHDNGDDVDIVNSEEDLIKIVLAHLREDPKYYTKLKKVEEIATFTFTIDGECSIITEAPHITVGEKVIDLEFEKNKDRAIRNILKAIMREEITDKYGSKFKLSNDKEVNAFINKLMRNPQVRRAIK